MSQYGKTDYWEDRYTRDPEPFDWYQRFSGLKDIITTHIDNTSRLLNVGASDEK